MCEASLQEFRKQTAAVDLKWNKAEFLRLVKQINHEMGFTDLRYQTSAVLALQKAAEATFQPLALFSGEDPRVVVRFGTILKSLKLI